jgi:uncharacterized protein
MPYFALIYRLVDDYLERRASFRSQHLALANLAHARGELVLAGAFAQPADKAILIFYVTDESAVEVFANSDPYVINGLVKDWEIRPWNVVVGNLD